MTEIPDKPVLLTGASGNLGRSLTRALGAQGWTLRLTDIAPFPDPLPAGASFTRADLGDGVTMLRLAEGCGAILHFGGVSVERPFEEVLGPNLRGLYHIYEAARREQARVIFASSNHSIGFHERTETIDTDAPFMPDGFYGLSKAYGELMGQAVLEEARRGERLRPHRLQLPRAGGRAHAGHLAVLRRPVAAGGPAAC